jgi:hypothetical protein
MALKQKGEEKDQSGHLSFHGLASSKAAATFKTVRSSERPATIWTPMGKPSAVQAQGKEAAGWPVKLNG